MEDKVKGQIMRMNSWQKEVTLFREKSTDFYLSDRLWCAAVDCWR